MTSAVHHWSALESWEALQRGEVTPTELVEASLLRIDRFDGEIGAFATVEAGPAIERAAALSAGSSRAAILWGLPVAEKDLSAREGRRTTFGSRAFADAVPRSSDRTARALDAAGAVSVGATCTPEFGLAGYTISTLYGPTSIPGFPGLGAGGSSGGAAAAVAAGFVPFAVGSDGGGSIRIPAAACGLVGLKPSRGRLPSHGGTDSLAGLVTAGPLARTVADVALLFEALLERDTGRVPHPYAVGAPDAPDSFLAAAVRAEGRFRIAVCRDSPWQGVQDIVLDPAAERALDLTIEQLTALGHEINEVALPDAHAYPDAFGTVWQVGAASIALSDAQAALVEPLTAWLRTRGAAHSSVVLADALAALTAFERAVIEAFAPFDAVLTPGLAMTPRPNDWWDLEDGEANFAQQVAYAPFSSYANVTGLPSISLPVHRTTEGLPMAAQLIGQPGGEATLLAIAGQVERRIPWRDEVESRMPS